MLVHQKNTIAESLIDALTVDVFWRNKKYPAKKIALNQGILPDWLTDHSVRGIVQHMDLMFNLTMNDSTLYERLDYQPKLGTYVNVIITSRSGEQSAIKDASVIECIETNLTVLGGIFALENTTTYLED